MRITSITGGGVSSWGARCNRCDAPALGASHLSCYIGASHLKSRCIARAWCVKEWCPVAMPDAIGVRDARSVAWIEVGGQAVLGKPAYVANLVRMSRRFAGEVGHGPAEKDHLVEVMADQRASEA